MSFILARRNFSLQSNDARKIMEKQGNKNIKKTFSLWYYVLSPNILMMYLQFELSFFSVFIYDGHTKLKFHSAFYPDLTKIDVTHSKRCLTICHF